MNEREELILYKMGDISKLLEPGRERVQNLSGFEDHYTDIVDYIIRCTYRIWEEKGLGLIYGHYQHNVKIWTTEGLTYGREAVIAASAQTQAAFPDLRLYGDEVIWSGNDMDGFHSSHRITWVGTNTGYSKYGPPTGRKIVRTGIAHCFVQENRVVEEWIARDEMSLVLQLGYDPVEKAKEMVAREAKGGLEPLPTGEIERVQGQNTPAILPDPPDQFDPDYFVRRSYHEVWNWRLLNTIDRDYASNHLCHASAGRELYGRGALKAFILSMLAAFPDAALEVDHVDWLGSEAEGYRVAVRWNLLGTHTGPGIYGEPTGKQIRLLGISHHLIQDGKSVEEWMLFDEFALLKQLFR